MDLARRLWHVRYVVAYAALATWLVTQVRHFHDPRTGFSSLVMFGDRFQPRHISRLRDVPIYTYARSDGYDGQFYAQLAVAGNPLHPELRAALDSAGYRSRRVLLPLLAYGVGLGRPAWVVQVYALSNVLCWLLLAWLLARWWFPPTDVHNLLRWGGTLFGEGMLGGVTHSLVDGPALLVIALGVRAIETNRAKLGAVLLGAAGLIRETSVLCAAAFVPTTRQERSSWRRAASAIALCVLPAVAWTAFLSIRFDGIPGARNFELPLAGFVGKAGETLRAWRDRGFDDWVQISTLALVALGTQAVFMLASPRPDRVWWRIGAAFSLLWLFLGEAIWEGAPGAATRVLLPLSLAFNVLAPRTRRGLVLLLAGNLTVLSATDVLNLPVSEQNVFTKGVTCTYVDGWHQTEVLGRHTWRWASGRATLRFHNPNPDPVTVTIEVRLTTVRARTVTLRAPGLDRSFSVPGGKQGLATTVGPVRLAPGSTDLTFSSPEPAWQEPPPTSRNLTFALHDLYAVVAKVAD